MATYYVAGMPYSATLSHHGILGQKWGIRRYQNLDGTLTPAGKERYGSDPSKMNPRSLQRQIVRNIYFHDRPRTYDALKKYEKAQKRVNADELRDQWKISSFLEPYRKAVIKGMLEDMGYDLSLIHI